MIRLHLADEFVQKGFLTPGIDFEKQGLAPAGRDGREQNIVIPPEQRHRQVVQKEAPEQHAADDQVEGALGNLGFAFLNIRALFEDDLGIAQCHIPNLLFANITQKTILNKATNNEGF